MNDQKLTLTKDEWQRLSDLEEKYQKRCQDIKQALKYQGWSISFTGPYTYADRERFSVEASPAEVVMTLNFRKHKWEDEIREIAGDDYKFKLPDFEA